MFYRFIVPRSDSCVFSDSRPQTPDFHIMDTPVKTAAKPDPPQDASAVTTEIHDTTDFTQLPTLLFRSLAAVIIGTLILRLASQTMGQMLQYYLAEIDR